MGMPVIVRNLIVINMWCIGVMMITCHLGLAGREFKFDHAFRKQGEITKRMGLAVGEESLNEGKESLEQHSTLELRRVLDMEDQDAVETIEDKVDRSGSFYKGAIDRSGSVQKKAKDRSGSVHKYKKATDRTGSLKKKATDRAGIVHKREGSNNVYKNAVDTGRTVISLATNNALEPTTIATYLTQMWAANIFQTIGWTIVGSLSANRGVIGRSFQGDGRESSDDHQPQSLLDMFNRETVATILRGLASAAEKWPHHEL